MKDMSSRLFFHSVFLAVLWMTPCLQVAHADDEPKIARIDQIVGTLQRLAQLSKKEAPHQGQKDFNQKVQEDVSDSIPKLDADQLGKLAMICLTIYSPGDASDVGYDEVYYAGFWECLNRLFKIGDDSSLDALRFVKDHACLDGGEKLMFDESMEALQKRTHK